MKLLNDLKVSSKLVTLVVVATIALFAVGLTGYHYLTKAAGDMDEMYNNGLLVVAALNDMRAHSRAIEADTFDLMITTDGEENKRLFKDIAERAQKVDQDLALYEKSALQPFEKEKLAELKANLQKFREGRKVVFELAQQNKNAEAYRFYNDGVRQASNAYQQTLRELSDYNVQEAEKSNKNNTANSKEAVLLFCIIIVGSVVLIAALGWAITRAITSSLAGAIEHLGLLAKGDFSLDVPEGFLRLKDEFGVLAKAFYTMQQNMRDLIRRLSQTSEQLAASAEEMNASAEQSAMAANQVAETITEVATGADKQLQSIDGATATVAEVSRSIQRVVENNTVAAASSAKAAEVAQEGTGAVKTAIDQMSHIEVTVNRSASVVAKLGERSKEIGQIVDTIAGIAGQTNLLALNAAIEAARAGEQGRGFAVVAEEVRKLAEQSQDAAKQIAALIKEIQTDTDRAVVAMNDGTKEVKRGTEVVNNAGQSFRQITGLVDELATQGREIATSIVQVGTGSDQVVSAMKVIHDVSKGMAGQTQTVSAATEEQSAAMQEIASSSQSLARMAEELQKAIQQFKV